MKSIFIIAIYVFSFSLLAQDQDIQHVEPPYWWYGMQNPYLEIMIHCNNISHYNVTLSNKDIKIISTLAADSKNYIFIGLDVSKINAKTNFDIILKNKSKKIKIPYTLKTKRLRDRYSSGINSEDAIYLITPDRYKNGNPHNDNLPEYLESSSRTEYGRHGGDLEGIITSLDYIHDLGFNSIWLNPVLDNNMLEQSYHGYAITDYYSVDQRLGGTECYLRLRDSIELKNMNLIMDMVANHCGSNHWWLKDLPMKNWINYQDEYHADPLGFNELTNHRKTALLDPYSSESDRNKMTKGWFVPSMPDLNQRNPQLATYLIQNSIWWVEVMNLAGIRQDTYSYPDPYFLTDWSCSLIEEFPNLFIVGEEWFQNPLVTSYWQAGDQEQKKLSADDSCLPSVMDFPLQMTVNKALKDNESWNAGFSKMYEILVNDILYPNPNDLVIFPDNHDMDRIFTQLDENVKLWKMAMIYYATMRGIPQIYYGTEVMMSHPGTSSHGYIRNEFPGGWVDHHKNAFSHSNLSYTESEASRFIKKLYNWRKNTPAVYQGELRHYIPVDNVYIYFRTNSTQQVMVILNKNKNNYELDLSRFSENLEGYVSAIDYKDGLPLNLSKSITLINGESKIIIMEGDF